MALRFINYNMYLVSRAELAAQSQQALLSEETDVADAHKQMSRGAQTVWICGTLAILALAGVAIWAQQPDDNDPYDQCRGFFGTEDRACRARIARDHIYGRYDPSVDYMVEDASEAWDRISPEGDRSIEDASDSVGAAAAAAAETEPDT